MCNIHKTWRQQRVRAHKLTIIIIIIVFIIPVTFRRYNNRVCWCTPRYYHTDYGSQTAPGKKRGKKPAETWKSPLQETVYIRMIRPVRLSAHAVVFRRTVSRKKKTLFTELQQRDTAVLYVRDKHLNTNTSLVSRRLLGTWKRTGTIHPGIRRVQTRWAFGMSIIYVFKRHDHV